LTRQGGVSSADPSTISAGIDYKTIGSANRPDEGLIL